MYFQKRALWIAALAALLAGGYACQQQEPAVEAEAEALIEEAQRLHCRLQALHEESVALWDAVSARLSEALPAGMPPDERRNMLAVRNTGLIQMFEVYPTLDTAVHRIVENAGRADSGLAAQMRAAKDSLDANEARVRSLLARLEAGYPALLPEWKARFDTVKCKNG